MDEARMLLSALLRRSGLPCLRARAMLGLIVAYERGGGDADSVGAFRPALYHLDECAACLKYYKDMSER